MGRLFINKYDFPLKEFVIMKLQTERIWYMGSRRISLVVCISLFIPLFFVALSFSDGLTFQSSTQYLWGNDIFLGQNEPVIAEYLKMKYDSDGSFKFSGYGRASEDFGSGAIYDTSGVGRLYYMYMDYNGVKDVNLRAGRQLVASSAGMLLLDGAAVDLKKLSQYAGISVSAGTEVQMGLNSDYTSNQKPVFAASLYLRNAGLANADLSYMRRYDDNSISRETIGLNGSSSFGSWRPYLHSMYNSLTNNFDSTTAGVDIFPSSRFSLKGEYYEAFPTFDATSIYSVFAVDKYFEYMFRASYDVNLKFNIFTSYKRQEYQENDSADVASAGGIYKVDKTTYLNASFDYRDGLDGLIWGAQAHGDYGISENLTASAGFQRDMYDRVVTVNTWRNASRYWLGCKYMLGKNLSASLRLEDSVNDTFVGMYGGRAVLDATF
jgi:hypothetical protein